MYAKPDKHEEGLNMIERKSAYGMTCTPAKGNPGHHTVQLKAVKDRPIDVYSGPDGVLHAVGPIAGKQVEFLSIDVESKSSWGLPKVVKIVLSGRDPTSGELVQETIKP